MDARSHYVSVACALIGGILLGAWSPFLKIALNDPDLYAFLNLLVWSYPALCFRLAIICLILGSILVGVAYSHGYSIIVLASSGATGYATTAILAAVLLGSKLTLWEAFIITIIALGVALLAHKPPP